MNPMSFIGDGKTTIAPHWYIRHGARDRDTAFPVPVNFATKLRNAGKDVNFLLAWNRPHSGDYALDELFQWIAEITKKKGGERGPRQGGHMEINKDSDSTFVALKNETLKKFKQLTFNDTQTGKTMEYNLLVPEGAEAGEKLPLVLFMADAM